MNTDSIYPDVFRVGFDRLHEHGLRDSSFLGLLSALEHFRRDITDRGEVDAILGVADLYIKALDLFDHFGFFLVNPATFDFELAHCSEPAAVATLDELVQREIVGGRFAWALRQTGPCYFNSAELPVEHGGVFHPLAVASHRVGMFCGVLKRQRIPIQELAFRLLSLLLGSCADALTAAKGAEGLKSQILAANEHLREALRQNEILARIPAESPGPVLRLSNSGSVLYSNEAGEQILKSIDSQVGDMVTGQWLELLRTAYYKGVRLEFETSCDGMEYSFLIVPVQEEGYANFYGTDITSRKRIETEREKLIVELREALGKVKTLSGLVPICAWCKKIRDDKGFWNDVEVYVQTYSEAVFSHGVCPDCRHKYLKPGRGHAGSASETP